MHLEEMTPNQSARRDRVIESALELASEGGYDAVQMRDVAISAQVALGTIYRYFSSKDHLLAAAQLELWRKQSERLKAHPAKGESDAERVMSVLNRSMRGALNDPQRTQALVTASSSPDPAVRECQSELMGIMDEVLGAAMSDVEPTRRDQIAVTLRQVWFAWLLGWVNGWNDAPTVSAQLETATRLLLA